MTEKQGDVLAGRRQSALNQLAISLLAVWMIVSAALFALLDLHDSAVVGWSLTGLIVSASLAKPFKKAGALATIFSVVLFIAVQVDRIAEVVMSRTGTGYLVIVLVGVLCLVLTGLVCGMVARQLGRVDAQIEQSERTIGELTLYDGLTGVLKSVYGDKLLSEEIERSRRYNRPLSLMLFDVDDWPSVIRDRGKDGAEETLRTTSRTLKASVRSIDVIVRRLEARFAVILPETKVEDAQLVAERVSKSLSQETGLRFRVGVAEFPGDALTKDELLSEADAALEFARTANLVVAGRGMLR